MQESSKVTQQLGRYRLVATLGQGGMGTIWLAVAKGLGEFRKLLVVKELRRDLTRNQRFVEMFLDEAKLAARLSHPNIVQTLEAGEEDNRYFLSMEFLDGQPLSEVMQRATLDPQVSLGIRLRILCGALAGLHYAHELRDYDGTDLQIVHRDVSPQNVFVTYDGQVKVVDFGIAKASDAGAFTQPGVFKGKIAYASPEQIKGQPVDRRADVFAMGVLLWEVVSLERLVKGKPSQASVEARLAGAEPRLAQIAPDVEPLLAEICDRAMQVEPSARFSSAEQFRIALEQYLLVSGERIDAATIAGVLQNAFAGERAAMHRMIDSHLKESDLSESLVRRLAPLPVDQVSHDDPTTVADLSELVESSRSELPDQFRIEQTGSWQRSLRGGRLKWAGAVAVLLLVALSAYAALGTRGTSASVKKAVAPASSGAVGPAKEAPASASTTTMDALLAAPPRALEPTTRERSADDSDARQREVSTMPPRAHGVAQSEAASGRRSSEQSASADATTLQAGPSTKDRGPGSRRQPTAATSQAEHPPLAPTADAPIPTPGGAGETSGRIGEDLRKLRKNERRKLDLEDPFR